MSFRVTAVARREFFLAAVWYDQRQMGLGDRFVNAVKRAFERVGTVRIRTPRKRPRVGGGTSDAVLLMDFPIR